MRNIMPARLLSFFLGWMLATATVARSQESRWEIVQTETRPGDKAELKVEIIDVNATRLAARVILTDAAGNRLDGSGRGLYADGRFFVDGEFTVEAAAGEARLQIQCGPHRVPIDAKIALKGGTRTHLRASMVRWFDPAANGWFGGDNHVHTQHDKKTVIRVDPGYTALQARANDLSFITEADTEVTSEASAQFDTPAFLYRIAPELRPGPFVGHLNTPGVSRPIAPERFQELVRHPLPRLGLHGAVRELGGAMIHTHPFTPPHQLHWMGAGEVWSDAALGRCADLLDLDSPQSEMLWHAVLNLGNRMGCSSYTDCALGREKTPSPGDRRVYCRAEKLDYARIVEAMRKGNTVATNGGPLFVEATLNSVGPGGTIDRTDAKTLPLHLVCHSFLPMRTVQVICGGVRIQAFDLRGRTGRIELKHDLSVADRRADWFVIRAENEKGDWSVTSPIYIASEKKSDEPAAAVLLEISNHTRFVELRREFFAHAIVTVRPPERLREVRLLRDDKPLHVFRPDDGDKLHEGRIPVTGAGGDYGPGWMWHREGDHPCHFQADWPTTTSGWYRLEATTSLDRVLRSEAIRFSADDKPSQAISSAKLNGPGTSLTLRGYGEEMPRDEITLPFAGDHWWYPNNTAWRLQARFHGETRELKGGSSAVLEERFP